MNITIIGVGKIKEKYLKLGIDEFSKRLTKYCKLDVIELDDEKCPENLSEKDMLIVKDKEGKIINDTTQWDNVHTGEGSQIIIAMMTGVGALALLLFLLVRRDKKETTES